PMIQQVRKINLLGTSAMLITFSVSVFLVTFITPRKTRSVKRHVPVASRLTSQQSSPSNAYYGPFTSAPEQLSVVVTSPISIDPCSPMEIKTNWMEDCPEVTHR